MKLLIVITIIWCSTLSQAAIDPDEKRDFPEYIEARNLNLEEHTVTTDDGYILVIHRILPKNYDPATYSKNRKPVVLFHGLYTQSSVFFYNTPFLTANDSNGDNLGFALLNTEKYDVWVPNARGNGISDDHVNMSKWNPDYWKFSYEQIGLHDIPAILKVVRNKTGHKTVGWIGYSQGGQSLFALLSLHPEYAQYIHPFVGMAATTYMTKARSPFFRALEPFRFSLEVGPGPFLLVEKWLNVLTQGVCRPVIGTTFFCTTTYTLMFGPSKSFNKTRVPVYSHFLPAPVSNWQMAHILQNMNSDRYHRFDYDSGHLIKNRNKKIYGTDEAPSFPLENIPKNFTALMIYGSNDYLDDPKDAMRLVNELKGRGVNIDGYEVEKEWSHFDFCTGLQAGKYVYDKAIKFLDDNVKQDGPK